MARTGLTMEDYVSYIQISLGSPVIWLEIEDMVPDIVKLAFQELKSYMTDVETMTVPYQNVIDLTGKKVNHIHYLMRAQQNISVAGLQDMMYIYTSRNRSSFPNNSFTLGDYARGLMVQQNKAALSTDLEFYFDKREEKLYVYAQQVLPGSITLVYTPDYESVDDIIEPFWQNLLRRLSLAMTKETLGRVRGKYTLNSATYNLDADQLLSEAQNELTEIRTYLNNNKDLLLPLD
jgi:hypothetical protein